MTDAAQDPTPFDLAGRIAQCYVQRRDVYAEQFANGAYSPVKSPLKRSVLGQHLTGERTLGHYLIDLKNRCRVFVLDIDLTKTGTWKNEQDEVVPIEPRKVWLDPSHPAWPSLLIELRCLAEGFALRAKSLTGMPVAVSSSGSKGMHVSCFTGPIPAGEAREIAQTVITSFNCFEPTRGANFWHHSDGHYPNQEVETFPKQDKVGPDGFGNLCRLPLGIHRRTNNRSFFVDLAAPMNELRELSPEVALSPEGYSW